jgi:hypothetical protein
MAARIVTSLAHGTFCNAQVTGNLPILSALSCCR